MHNVGTPSYKPEVHHDTEDDHSCILRIWAYF